MNERSAKLVEAAQSVFARYGVGKTTMNDIAREAGVARQTIYNAYPNKEAILRAAVRHAGEQTLDVVDAAWQSQDDLADKLDAFFAAGPLAWHDIIQASPDAAELVDGIHTTANDEMNEIAKLWNTRFTALVKEHAKDGSQAYQDAADIGEFIYSASANAKYNADNRAALERRLRVLKQSILALLTT